MDKAGLDVFGQVPTKKQYDCPCPNCSRSLAASRFAPHLEKCMGMGRISSRIASRRLVSNFDFYIEKFYAAFIVATFKWLDLSGIYMNCKQ